MFNIYIKMVSQSYYIIYSREDELKYITNVINEY